MAVVCHTLSNDLQMSHAATYESPWSKYMSNMRKVCSGSLSLSAMCSFVHWQYKKLWLWEKGRDLNRNNQNRCPKALLINIILNLIPHLIVRISVLAWVTTCYYYILWSISNFGTYIWFLYASINTLVIFDGIYFISEIYKVWFHMMFYVFVKIR